jgi:hypothetical protein
VAPVGSPQGGPSASLRPPLGGRSGVAIGPSRPACIASSRRHSVIRSAYFSPPTFTLLASSREAFTITTKPDAIRRSTSSSAVARGQRIPRVVHLPSTIAKHKGQRVGEFFRRGGPEVVVTFGTCQGRSRSAYLARASNVSADQSLYGVRSLLRLIRHLDGLARDDVHLHNDHSQKDSPFPDAIRPNSVLRLSPGDC